MVKIAPSILSADFSKLGQEIRDVEAAGADLIHVDVMDGHFVPPITIGPCVVRDLKKVAKMPLDVHLMVDRPEDQVDEFMAAGADILVVHVEATRHVHRTLNHIRKKGVRAGVAINPATPLSAVELLMDDMDMLVIMTVNPGWGGQTFIQGLVPKVAQACQLLEGRDVELEVDGGITPANAPDVVRGGATVLVAGSSVFKGKGSYGENIKALKRN
jgi:ribulose-phosphate 3-epimerase